MILGIAPKTNLKCAITYNLIAAIFNASLGALTKFSFSQLTAMQIVFARNFVALILFFCWLRFSKKESSLMEFLRPHSWGMQIVRSVAGFSSIYFFIMALKTIDLGDATVLFNTMPIFLPIVAFLWKGSKIHHKTWWGIITAFFGIMLIIRPGADFFQQGSFYGLLSGIAGSISTLSLRYSHYTDPTSRTLFYYFLICSVLSAFALPLETGSLHNAFTMQGLVLLAGIGILGLCFQVFFTLATKHAPAKLISPFYYSTVVFSVLYDRLLWHVQIDIYKIIGFVFIFIGVCLVVLLYPKEAASSKPGAQ